MTVKQKVYRLMVFLAALRHDHVAKHLAKHGLDADVVGHGWNLVYRLSPRRTDTTINTDDLAALNEWEDYWFPVIGAVLMAHYPDVHTRVFSDLKRGSGIELIVSVKALLDRIEEETALSGGQEMRDLLKVRGVTDEVVTEARDILAKLTTVGSAPEISPDLSAEEREAAADELWKFYLEWSAIARVAITDRKILRTLGFLKRSRSNSDGDPTIPVVP